MEKLSSWTNYHVGQDGKFYSKEGKIVSSIDQAEIFHTLWDATNAARAYEMDHVISVVYNVYKV